MKTQKLPAGTRVLIQGQHLHAGKTGTIDRYEALNISQTGKKFPVVNTDDGMSTFVFDLSQLKVIK